MKSWIVKLELLLGEYEKGTTTLVRATTEKRAMEQALLGECHNDPELSECGTEVNDDGWVYRVWSCDHVKGKERIALEKYL